MALPPFERRRVDREAKIGGNGQHKGLEDILVMAEVLHRRLADLFQEKSKKLRAEASGDDKDEASVIHVARADDALVEYPEQVVFLQVDPKELAEESLEITSDDSFTEENSGFTTRPITLRKSLENTGDFKVCDVFICQGNVGVELVQKGRMHGNKVLSILMHLLNIVPLGERNKSPGEPVVAGSVLALEHGLMRENLLEIGQAILPVFVVFLELSDGLVEPFCPHKILVLDICGLKFNHQLVGGFLHIVGDCKGTFLVRL